MIDMDIVMVLNGEIGLSSRYFYTKNHRSARAMKFQPNLFEMFVCFSQHKQFLLVTSAVIYPPNIVCVLGVSTGSIFSAVWGQCLRLGTRFGRLNLHYPNPKRVFRHARGCRWRIPSDIRPELTQKPDEHGYMDSHMCPHCRVTRVSPKPSCCTRARARLDLVHLLICSESQSIRSARMSHIFLLLWKSLQIRNICGCGYFLLRSLMCMCVQIDLHNSCNCILGSKYYLKFANCVCVCFQWLRILFLSISRARSLAIKSALHMNKCREKLQCFCMIQYSYGLNMK